MNCFTSTIWPLGESNMVWFALVSKYLITGNGALRKMSLHVIKLHEIKPFWKILSLIMCRYNLMHS